MKKQLITAVVAVAMLASNAVGAQPMQGNRGHSEGLNSRGCYSGERSSDCSQRRSAEQRSNHHYVYRNGHYEDSTGAAIAGGIIGIMLGAAVVGSSSDRDYYNHHRNDRGWRTRCRSAYNGFDYRTGTYLGPDGYRHYCTR